MCCIAGPNPKRSTTLMIAAGAGLLPAASGAIVGVAVPMAGAARDGYMAFFMTTISEIDGVGILHASTAMGLAMTLSRLGGLIAPPLGNSLAGVSLRLPFLLWAAMALVGFAGLAWFRRNRIHKTSVTSSLAGEDV